MKANKLIISCLLIDIFIILFLSLITNKFMYYYLLIFQLVLTFLLYIFYQHKIFFYSLKKYPQRDKYPYLRGNFSKIVYLYNKDDKKIVKMRIILQNLLICFLYSVFFLFSTAFLLIILEWI